MKPLTPEAHAALGRDLRAARDTLIRAVVTVGNAGGFRDQSAKNLAKAATLIDRARSRLEARLFLDHPNEADMRTYYPGQDGST